MITFFRSRPQSCVTSGISFMRTSLTLKLSTQSWTWVIFFSPDSTRPTSWMTRSNPIHDSVKPIYRSRFIEYRMLQLFWKFKKVNKKVSYRKQTATSSFVCVKRYEHTSWGQPLEAPPLGSRAWPRSMDPVWNYPSPSWSPCKIRLTLCHATWARVGGPKDFGALGACFLGMGMSDPKTRTPAWINIRNLVKPCEHAHGDPPTKLGPSRPAFQRHSRPSKVTQIDRMPMTSYSWFIVTMEVLFRTVSEINGDISQNTRFFFTARRNA